MDFFQVRMIYWTAREGKKPSLFTINNFSLSGKIQTFLCTSASDLAHFSRLLIYEIYPTQGTSISLEVNYILLAILC